MADLLYIIAGLCLLFLGGEILLKGSISLAHTFKLSKLLVSAVIIGFGTSMPEMIVSVSAALKGSTDIALGNVIGSNIANILLIIGVSALIAPILLKNIYVHRDVLWMIFSAALLSIFMFAGTLNFYVGTCFVITLAIYIIWSVIDDRKKSKDEQQHIEEDAGPEKPYSPVMATLFCLGGIAALMIGAHLLIDGAVSAARHFSIPESVIGLTLVAVGTALPELATAIVASIKRHSEVIVGNILGSNIFNILAILGVTTIIHPIPVSPQMLNYDIWVMLLITLCLGALLLFKSSITRILGSIMLISYIAYSTLLYLKF